MVCQKLRGMCGDHAAGEKSLSDGMQRMKRHHLIEELGEKHLDSLDTSTEETQDMLWEWQLKKIDDVGGIEAWEALSAQERAVRDLATVNAMVQSLGEDEFDSLEPADKRALTLYVWSGCCMHKDQNSFKGGNTRMMEGWKILKVLGPIALANKYTADAVREVLNPEAESEPLSESDAATLAAVTRGGAKAVALAGAIFNNRTDKKGQGDAHILFLEHKLGVNIRRFPQTNNTRFGSHGEAAGELISRLDTYIDFLEAIKMKKTTTSWTNIEKNVFDVLHDGPTLTELAVMALYQQVITHPYMRLVRAPETEALNALDLGPLHAEIREHCELLIAKPELVLDFEVDGHVEGAFDGKKWEREDVVESIKVLHAAGRLPYLKEMFVFFLEGALATWLRFSSEYAPGGLIDGLSDEEKYRAWLPLTNDRNEGALGSYVSYARTHPSATLHTHNVIASFTRNHTQKFVDSFFKEEDHQYVLGAARELDKSGMEHQRLQEQKDFDAAVLAAKKAKLAERRQKELNIESKLNGIALIICTADIYLPKMTGPRLDEQLEKLRRLWGPKIKVPIKSHIKKVGEKRSALKAAFKDHLELLKLGKPPGEQEPVTERTTDDWYKQEDEEMGVEDD